MSDSENALSSRALISFPRLWIVVIFRSLLLLMGGILSWYIIKNNLPHMQASLSAMTLWFWLPSAVIGVGCAMRSRAVAKFAVSIDLYVIPFLAVLGLVRRPANTVAFWVCILLLALFVAEGVYINTVLKRTSGDK